MKRYYSDVRDALKELYQSDSNGLRGMRTASADRLVATVGYEGTGKSNFALIMFDEWAKFNGVELTEADIKYFCAAPEEVGEAILQPKDYQMITLDEGVLLAYGRTGLSQTNILVNQALMVCRGLHLYINVLIPNILDLDGYLRKNRLSALWVMLPAYKVAYFSRKRFRQLIGKMAFQSRNGNFADPMKMGVKPNFIAKVPLYEGVLAKPYAEMKRKNMHRTLEKLSVSLLRDKKKVENLTPNRKKMKELLAEGKKVEDVAEMLKISQKTVANYYTIIKQKLGVSSPVEMVRLAMKHGLIQEK